MFWYSGPAPPSSCEPLKPHWDQIIPLQMSYGSLKLRPDHPPDAIMETRISSPGASQHAIGTSSYLCWCTVLLLPTIYANIFHKKCSLIWSIRILKEEKKNLSIISNNMRSGTVQSVHTSFREGSGLVFCLIIICTANSCVCLLSSEYWYIGKIKLNIGTIQSYLQPHQSYSHPPLPPRLFLFLCPNKLFAWINYLPE